MHRREHPPHAPKSHPEGGLRAAGKSLHGVIYEPRGPDPQDRAELGWWGRGGLQRELGWWERGGLYREVGWDSRGGL